MIYGFLIRLNFYIFERYKKSDLEFIFSLYSNLIWLNLDSIYFMLANNYFVIFNFCSYYLFLPCTLDLLYTYILFSMNVMDLYLFKGIGEIQWKKNDLKMINWSFSFISILRTNKNYID